MKILKRFLRNASGSAFEVEYILLLSKDLNYISEEKFIELTPKAEELKNENLKTNFKIEEDINKKRKIDKYINHKKLALQS